MGLYEVFIFLILAIVAGLLGFTGVEIISIDIARILFFIFIILFLFSLVRGISRK
jgi:uncharacterized membrane protein YtjA (UPF0391 family)